MNKKKPLSYKDSGVDTKSSNFFIDKIKLISKKTKTKEVIKGIGPFSAICSIPKKYLDPVLVLSTDGVGTKLYFAIKENNHNDIGIDLVAMCVNDIITQGADPLFFLDYYATGKIDIDISLKIINGISKGCKISGCSLVGGETAEMPGFYSNKNYDLSGFCVGVVERSKIIDINNVKIGDEILALSSSGLHSNGYSLIRKIISQNNINYNDYYLNNKKLINYLLTPTRIYSTNILNLIKQIKVNAISHITGGSFLDNIPRITPKNTCAVIYEDTWNWPLIFKWIQETGNIKKKEMYKTFNCGVGMVVIVSKNDANLALKILNQMGEKAWKIGKIVHKIHENKKVLFK
ncbi:purM [Wigglesworthia glossinidia endosymbiont of Glossina brevipalpis]|uniref:Phosphoribosylformylglycinamidine cyclo-ligase n=1 Tax=Wigglesworthia glossinidia brevipalpis TaxID=36870 RepID=Q8D2M2_WIGBR|nr:purM [Wigglesworthia glossinidia endosymbiont of Glossina brevipalpis]